LITYFTNTPGPIFHLPQIRGLLPQTRELLIQKGLCLQRLELVVYYNKA